MMKGALFGFNLIILFAGCYCNFSIDWENDVFLKDGKEFRFYSGSMHYFRVPRPYWKDRMYKMKLAGLNTIQTYIAWNDHEPQVGQYRFTGNHDLTAYLDVAKSMGLLVVLRPGPYICAEWNFGGLPYWLLKLPGIKFREYSKPYIAAIGDWFSVVLPKVEPYLYKNGGPIIAVQVENEYGAYGPNVCDHDYLHFLLDQYITYFGDDVVYYTVDNTNVVRLACGGIPGLLKTLDFGTNKIPHFQFEMLRKYMPHGPLVNTEFWDGWFDKWGELHANVTAAIVAKRLDEMLQLNASVNMYMFEGGTNFGYDNGAMSKDGYAYNARVTSYDYNSPLTEAGDTTPKYWAIRKVMSKYVELPHDPVPPHSPKWQSGQIKLPFKHSVFDHLDTYATCTNANLPLTMEHFNQSGGFIMYRIVWSEKVNSISLFNVHDRATVYVNGEVMGVIDRRIAANGTIVVTSDSSSSGVEGTVVTILVENMGRVNHGSFMGDDFKGITHSILINNQSHSSIWTVCSLPLDKPPTKRDITLSVERHSTHFTPTFFCGEFNTSNRYDTFLDPRGWGKGVAFVNGFNLGRYWPGTGPQVTLYTPGISFTDNNWLCVLELEMQRKDGTVQFIKKPILGNTKD